MMDIFAVQRSVHYAKVNILFNEKRAILPKPDCTRWHAVSSLCCATAIENSLMQYGKMMLNVREITGSNAYVASHC